jgi:hypothetical protein
MNPKGNSNSKNKNAHEGKKQKHLDSISRLIEAPEGKRIGLLELIQIF